jgi:DNA-binding NtrC family response regulator
MVREQRFRSDLLFRIETMRLHLPPLRDRPEDIRPLLAVFLERAQKQAGVRAPRMSAAAMRTLLNYHWPGNVRELEHAIEHAVLVAEKDEIRPEDLPARLTRSSQPPIGGEALHGGTYRNAKLTFERAYFTRLLSSAHGNISRAAQLAGIHRATLHDKIRHLELSTDKAGHETTH